MKNIIKNNKYEINIKEDYIHLINYLKIEDMKDNQIKILLNKKQIVIKGQSLTISSLSEEEILVKGNIKGIDFISE